METQRTIRVTGKGALRLRPDLTRLTLTLAGREAEYGAALSRSASDGETLRGALGKLGFARAELKTVQFSVDAVFESFQDEKGNYRSRFAGYEFRHVLKLEFPMDNEKLGRTLWELAHCGVSPEFDIGYTLSDPEAAKQALLAGAVRDARAKAETLAAAAGVALGALRSIDYSWGELSLEVRPMRKLAMAENAMADGAGGFYDMDINPDDVSISDTVTLLWEIAE